MPIPGWWVVMVLNQAKLGRNYDENSRRRTKQSICFQCLGKLDKIGSLWCRLCGIIIHQPGTGIEAALKEVLPIVRTIDSRNFHTIRYNGCHAGCH